MKAFVWIASALPLSFLVGACSDTPTTPIPTDIVLSSDSLNFTAFDELVDPPVQTVRVSSGAPLAGLALGTIRYYGRPGSPWLTASLNGLTITLSASVGTVPAGSYTATVPVKASNAALSAEIGVNFVVDKCGGMAATTLAVGESVLLDPASSNGCLEIPAAAPAGAEHLVVALSAKEVAPALGAYNFRAAPVAEPPAPVSAVRASARVTPSSPVLNFHMLLRDRERALATDPSRRRFALAPRGPATPPVVGEQRAFKVCANLSCDSFVSVSATAMHVGPRGAIFLDDTVPTGGYLQSDINRLGSLFDNYLYPIDTTAFGRESDLDNNQVVIILLTDRVNQLVPNCNAVGAIVTGYFFGLDLIPDPNSNQGEIFYGLVPDPGNSLCTVSRLNALDILPPTFIHEFQHMISFNRHVLLPSASALGPEDVWLNEGLSRFAEELGGRQIPSSECLEPVADPCMTEFTGEETFDAYGYLSDPESSYLIADPSNVLTLAEYGGAWLFVRWFAEQSPTDTLLATDVTRALLGADNPTGVTQAGVANIQAVASALGFPWTSWEDLLGDWHLTNYLEGRTGFTDLTGRLRYRTWDFRAIYAANPMTFPRPYPLIPDSTENGWYARTGSFRGGSGHHLRVIQPPAAGPVTLKLTTDDHTMAPRFAVIRIR